LRADAPLGLSVDGPVEDAVDGSVVTGLQGELGHETVAELVDLFADDGRCRVDDIGGAWDRGDLESLVQAAHGLKGSALNMGARELATLCQTLEHAEDRDEVGRLSARVPRAFDRAVTALRSAIGRR